MEVVKRETQALFCNHVDTLCMHGHVLCGLQPGSHLRGPAAPHHPQVRLSTPMSIQGTSWQCVATMSQHAWALPSSLMMIQLG